MESELQIRSNGGIWKKCSKRMFGDLPKTRGLKFGEMESEIQRPRFKGIWKKCSKRCLEIYLKRGV